MKSFVRSQSEEVPQEKRYTVRTVGDVTSFANADPLGVTGVGLVTGLNGTGSVPRKGNLRAALEHELKKAKIRGIKEILDSKDTALVLVSAQIPAGALKGDKVDLFVQVPRGSRTTSLRGGKLEQCRLFTSARAGDLSRRYADTEVNIRGRDLVIAKGPVLAGYGSGESSERLKEGRIWGGGWCKVGRSFHLIMDPEQQQAYLAGLVAERINETFHDELEGAPKQMARAKNDTIIFLGVPPQYKRNLRRYLRVVRAIPLSENAPGPSDEKPRTSYRGQLAEDLLDPEFTVKAALRLESLGRESIPMLKSGLKSNDPLVRFCSAESLAYLGSSACADELAKVVKEQPFLRAFALTALSSMDEPVTRIKLRELLRTDLDDETRYGAFRALRALDDREPSVAGRLLNSAFWLHDVPNQGEPLLHVSMRRRPQIIFFGQPAKLQPPFSLLAGDFVLTAAGGDEACTISYHGVDDNARLADAAKSTGISRVRSPLDLHGIFETMARQGASYSEVMELIRQAEEIRCLNCRVRRDALPQAITVNELVAAGKKCKKLWEVVASTTEPFDAIAELEIIRPVREEKLTPAPFDPPIVRNRKREAELELLRGTKAENGARTALRKK